MKIREIDLTSYRSHEHTTIKLARMTYLVGPAGSGKSSVLDALATLLTGRNRYIDKRGAGLQEDIRVGAKGFEVGATLDGLNGSGVIPVHRSKTTTQHSLTYPDCPGDVRRGQERLLGIIGASDEVVTALLDPALFADRTEDEQKATLRRLMSKGDIPVPEPATRAGVKSIGSSEALDTIIKGMKEGDIRDLNRDIKTLTQSMPEDPGEVGDIAKIEKQAHAAQSKLEESLSALTSKETVIKERRIRMSTLSEFLATEPKSSGDGPSIQELKAKAEQHDAASIEAEQNAASTERSLRVIETQGKTVSGMDAKCGVTPLFDCPLSPEDRKKMVTKLKSEFAEARKELKALQMAAEGVRKLRDKTREELDAARQQIDQGAKFKEALKEAKQIESELQSLQGSLPGLQKTVDSLRQELAQMEGPLEKSRSAKAALDQRKSITDQIDTKRRAQEVYAAALGSLEDLRASITSSGEDPMMKEVNAFMEPFGMGSARIESERFQVIVGEVPCRRLSSGQKVILDAAIRVAAAKLSGVGVIAIDDSNKLGEELSKRLFRSLYGSGVQVITCKTTDIRPTDEWAARSLDGQHVTAYWASNESLTGPSTMTCLAQQKAVTV
jgi:DNA repair exonuclease SbcCD ATPase subunit